MSVSKKTSQFIALVFAVSTLVAVGFPTPAPAADPKPISKKTTLTVSAAASLTDALKAIGREFQKQRPEIILCFNFASSGTLQRQIEQGAPVDVFVSAADKNMDELASRRLIERNTRRVIAGNRLVLIVPRGSKLSLQRFKDVASSRVERVAVGGPTVPAGMRARKVFTKLGIWDAVERKAVRAKDVRGVLTQVELGNVDAGVVYQSDAASSSKVRVVAIAPITMHKPIRYPAAVVTSSPSKNAARAFVNFLTGAKAKAVLRRYRFTVP